MTLIFVNRYFYPDQSATAQILADTAFHLAATGRAVTVITSQMAYGDPSQSFEASETVDGVKIVRVKTTRFGRDNLIGRALDYISFYITAFFAVLGQARLADLVIAKTDPPLLSVPLWIAARMKRAKFGNWLQDLYPEVAAELGVGLAKGPIGGMLKWLRNISLRRADVNVVIGQRMRDRLLSNKVGEAKIHIVPNWTDDVSVYPVAHQDNPLRKAWGFGPDDLVVGYSGNLGRAHDLDTVLGAAKQLQGDPSVHFLFIGGGKLREMLEAQIEEHGLSNIALKPYQPREELAQSLGVSDVHWASLIPDLEGLIVPSKVYGIAAAGRPVIFVGAPDGEIGALLAEHGFGAVIEPGDIQGLVDHIQKLKTSVDLRTQQGQAARDVIDTTYNKAASLSLWEKLVEAVA